MKFAIVMLENTESRKLLNEDHLAYRKQIEGWMGEQAQAGTLVGGEAFETATVAPVTVRRSADGTREAAEGPFADVDETLGGFILVEAADRAAAVEIAKTWPTPETLEVRPVWAAE
ncbi:YciI family protein [Streptomyces sp. NPDC004296]|uniref:YciI family protein n=1 Tax=Streptomyces sp. NPDC004296 TaxID=3364697 RepID=UPI0036794BFF